MDRAAANPFQFKGEIPGSKSIFNRALIVRSYFPVLDLHGHSDCDDVRHMREGLQHLRDRNRVYCGDGGTTLRFLAVRLSRLPGAHTLEGTARLMQRPKKGLLDLLSRLGVQASAKGKELFIATEGWKRSRGPIAVNTNESSQYASALLLNSWLLDYDLEFELFGEKTSESYFLLTLEMVKSLGMRIRKTPHGYLVPAGQRISKLEWTIEADLSSAFTMAAAGALAGEAVITNFPVVSSQPDLAFLEIFKQMKVDFSLVGSELTVRRSPALAAVDWNLSQCPDLFPVLAVLCSQADGSSRLFGAPHLALKESNRIAQVAELFTKIGVSHEVLDDGMVIHGNPQRPQAKSIVFDSDHDHRMVMAASLMKLIGHDVRLQGSEAISKSFPEFWSMIGFKL